MKTWVLALSLLATFSWPLPVAHAALKTDEHCYCTDKTSGETQDITSQVSSGAECIGASNTQNSCSVSYDNIETSDGNYGGGGDGFIPLVEIPGLNDIPNLASSEGIAQFLNNLYFFAIGIAVVLAVVVIIWGGAEYVLSEAVSGKGDGKKKIQQALFGLMLVLSPALVFWIINPAILNLNVNMPPLKVQWGKYPGPSTTAACSFNNDFCKADISACKAAGGTPKCKSWYSGNLLDPGSLSGACIDRDTMQCLPK